MGLLQANPCDALQRPKTQPSQPRGMSAEQIQQLLAVIPETKTGLRDKAIILTLTFTGRLESTDSLTTPNWQPVTGSGSVNVQPTAQQKYYRAANP